MKEKQMRNSRIGLAFVILVVLQIVFGSTILKVKADAALAYVDAEGNALSVTDYVSITSDNAPTEWESGWYVVTENVTIGSPIIVNGNVDLILCDGATLYATKGVIVEGEDSLTIWQQLGGSGALVAVGKSQKAGIGGDMGGIITINGGNITATGGMRAAGIGGRGASGTITINGGSITAAGSEDAAGIGSAGAPGTITINGGTVIATGGTTGAGIGCGSSSESGEIIINGGSITAYAEGWAGNGIGGYGGGSIGITINGGQVIAVGSSKYAGIGCHDKAVITINGGQITATGGQMAAGIGGDSESREGNVTINDGIVTATGGEDGPGIGGAKWEHNSRVSIGSGQVIAIGNGTAPGIGSGITYAGCCMIELGWMCPEDFIEASSYGGTVYFSTNRVFKLIDTDIVATVDNIDGQRIVPCLYNITLNCLGNGNLEVNSTCVQTGSKVFLTETHEYPNAFIKFYIMDKNGDLIPYAKANDNAYGFIMPASDVTVTAEFGEVMSYVDANGNEHEAVDIMRLSSMFAPSLWIDEWYAITEDITFEERIKVYGNVNLVLCDGATLTASNGITVFPENTLVIWQQKEGNGILNATGSINCAGIGGANGPSGTVIFNGGTITATGGDCGAGIGGGYEGSGGTITFNGGTITATGGDYGAGIGGGNGGSGGTITFNGGTITAIGGNCGAGIGGGYNGDGGTIIFEGGEISATGVKDGAGIGGGCWGSAGTIAFNGGTITATGGANGTAGIGLNGAAGIGGGYGGSGGTITINDGMITAQGSFYAPGIGDVPNASNPSEGATIIINDGNITANGGDNGAGIGTYVEGGTITINGGEIIATAGNYMHGIGGGYPSVVDISINGGDIEAYGGIGGDEGVITINDGQIMAIGYDFHSGIGGNNDVSVVINGGWIWATGGFCGAGIGGDNSSKAGTVRIGGGIINAVGGNPGPGIRGNVIIDGGQVTATGNGSAYGIDADQFSVSIILDWTNAGDFIEASSYNGIISFAEGKRFRIDGENMIATAENIGGKRIVPLITQEQCTVSVYSRASGTSTVSVANISVAPSNTVSQGDSVTVTAPDMSAQGYNFLGWHMVTEVTANGNEVVTYAKQMLCDKLSYTFEAWGDVAVVAVYEARGKALVKVNIVNEARYLVGESQTQQSGSMESMQYGTTLILTAVDADRVLCWMNESNKVLGTKASLSLVVTSDTSVTLVYKPLEMGGAFVQFENDFGQVLGYKKYSQSDTKVDYPGQPSKFGFIFDKWVFQGTDIEATQEQILSRVANGGVIMVLPKYVQDDTKYVVTVRYQDADGTEIHTEDEFPEILVGTGYTVTAPAVDGYAFSCWKDSNGTILGYNESYYFLVASDSVLTAVYVPDGSVQTQAQPVITIGVPSAVTTTDAHKVSCTVTRSIPDGYELQEHGILYAKGVEGLNETTFVYGTAGVSKYMSDKTSTSGVVKLNVKVSGETISSGDNVNVSFRGYMILKDNATGNVATYYTDIVSGNYAALNTQN